GDLDRRAERLGVGAEGLHADAAVIGGLFPGDGETVGRGRDLRAERAAAGSTQAAHRVAALRRRRFGGGGGGGRCARRAGRARRRGDGAAFGGRGGSGRRLRGRAADRARGDAGDGAGDGASEEREHYDGATHGRHFRVTLGRFQGRIGCLRRSKSTSWSKSIACTSERPAPGPRCVRSSGGGTRPSARSTSSRSASPPASASVFSGPTARVRRRR